MLPPSDPASAATAAAALCAPDARVAIAGVSSSGKSTLARRLGERLGVPYTEMDALHWGPAWTSRPAFLDDVRTLVADERWITEWQYTIARPLVIERATVLIWLDTPSPVTLARVVRRTIRRRRQREPLWGDNVEPGLPHALLAPEGIIRWTIRPVQSTDDRFPDCAPSIRGCPSSARGRSAMSNGSWQRCLLRLPSTIQEAQARHPPEPARSSEEPARARRNLLNCRQDREGGAGGDARRTAWPLRRRDELAIGRLEPDRPIDR